MKFFIAFVAITGLITTGVSSQKSRSDRNCGRSGPPLPDPILRLFDTDQDGEISAQELEQSEAVLKKLDWDKDGKLTREELPRPPRPEDKQGHGPKHERRHAHGPDHNRGPRPDHERGHRSDNAPHHRPGAGHPPHPQEDRFDGLKQPPVSKNASAGTVLFAGGYETDPLDHGRPVALIAAALGVEPQVFRDAFSNVKPARNGHPTEARARANKKVLLDALGKHGVTNERLDEVSNYYRYQPGRGNLWKHTPASATAITKEGKVTGFKITNAGSGYLTPPMVTVAGFPDLHIKTTLEFSKDFRSNGSIKSLSIEN